MRPINGSPHMLTLSSKLKAADLTFLYKIGVDSCSLKGQKREEGDKGINLKE